MSTLNVDVTGMFIRYSQYHGRWSPGDARGHAISSHGIDRILPDYFNLNTSGPF